MPIYVNLCAAEQQVAGELGMCMAWAGDHMNQRRILLTFAFAMALALMGSFGTGLSMQSAAAQDTSTQDHPLVGTWVADTDSADELPPTDVFTFSSDGTYLEVNAGGTAQAGAWEATGATTANLTIVSFEGDDEGNFYGTVTIRASIEVSADGATLTAEYTIEFTNPDGTSLGQAGPGSVTAERLMVEGPGTPVMTMEELFGAVEGDLEATPAP
jgi:hypothetical protein